MKSRTIVQLHCTVLLKLSLSWYFMGMSQLLRNKKRMIRTRALKNQLMHQFLGAKSARVMTIQTMGAPFSWKDFSMIAAI